MPDSVLNVQAVDTAINSDAYMPGLSNPTTAAEVKDIYMSSQFPTRERIAQLQELRREMVSRDSVDVEAGLGGLIAEIDRGRESLRDYAKSKLAVMSRENPELEIPQIRHGNYMPALLNPLSHVPELNQPLLEGGAFNIRDSEPEKFTIIVAYRGVHCPKCAAQLKAIDPMVGDLRAQGYDIVAVSMDDETRAQKAKNAWDISNLPIAYDMGLLTAKSWGLFISDARPDSDEPDLFSEPGIFVVAPDGALYAEYVQNTPFGRPPLDDVLAGLEFVSENGYPTRGTSTA